MLARPSGFDKPLLLSIFESIVRNGLRDFERPSIARSWKERTYEAPLNNLRISSPFARKNAPFPSRRSQDNSNRRISLITLYFFSVQANADQVTLTERPSTPATLLSFHSFGTSEQIRFQAVPGKQLHANQWRFFALSQEVEFFRGAIRASRAMPPWNATMKGRRESRPAERGPISRKQACRVECGIVRDRSSRARKDRRPLLGAAGL